MAPDSLIETAFMSALSVFDVPVCIYPYWDDPVKIPEMGN